MDGIMIYTSAFDICSQYDPDTQCRLVGYMARYALTGAEPEFAPDDAARFIWPAIRDKADRIVESYEKKASAGREGGTAKAQSKQTPSTSVAKPKQKRSRTVAESKQKPSTTVAESKQTPGTSVAEGKPDTDTDTEYEYESDIRENETRARAREEVTKRFEEFWAAYPRKIAKKDAEKAFMKLKPDEQLMQLILAALDRWKKSDQWTRDDGAYIPHPATWLHGERWKDEVPPPQRPREKTVVAQQYQQRDYSQETHDDDVPDWMRKRWEEMQREGTA